MKAFSAGHAVAAAIVIAGILIFWHFKLRTRGKVPMDSFRTFFLGGGDVGEFLTGNNNWGICFAFANSIWYYAYLGYYFGIYILFLQAAWSFAIVVMAFNLPRYINASADGTVHGYIGARYGARASVLAAVATLIGYTLNIGFEVFYSAHLFTVTIGGGDYELPFAILIALFIGGYCGIGGYLANVVTDPYQNYLGVGALCILACLVGIPLWTGGHIGELVAASHAATPSPSFVIGVVVFSFFFNLVDMANWQSIAANSQRKDKDLTPIRNGFLKAAAAQMVAPALLGTFFGASLKALNSEVADDAYFTAILGPHLAHMTLWNGVWLGVLFLGFFAVTISSAGSYLLAAMQTLALDVFKRPEAALLRSNALTDDRRHQIEGHVLDWVKRLMVVASIAMTLVFASLYYGLTHVNKQGLAFQFQFVMYGAAVTLVPCVISGLRRQRPHNLSTIEGGAFTSILTGLLCVIGPFAAAELAWTPLAHGLALVHVGASPDDIVNLTPLFGLVGASIAFFATKGGR